MKAQKRVYPHSLTHRPERLRALILDDVAAEVVQVSDAAMVVAIRVVEQRRTFRGEATLTFDAGVWRGGETTTGGSLWHLLHELRHERSAVVRRVLGAHVRRAVVAAVAVELGQAAAVAWSMAPEGFEIAAVETAPRPGEDADDDDADDDDDDDRDDDRDDDDDDDDDDGDDDDPAVLAGIAAALGAQAALEAERSTVELAPPAELADHTGGKS